MGKVCKEEKSSKKEKNHTLKSKKIKKILKKNYTLEALQDALKAVANGTPLRKAAKTFGVPHQTIFRKMRYSRKAKCRSGPPTVLPENIEQEIVQWIIYRSERGYPVTKTELLDSVQKYVTSLKIKTVFRDGRPGRHWYEGFRRRYPQLTIRRAQNLTLFRADVTEEDMREWFREIKTYLVNKNLLDIEGARQFNCDETNLELCPKSEKVFTKKGAKTVYNKVDALERESLTVLFMYSAAGDRAPPMIMYTYKEGVPQKVLENCPNDWAIGNSDSGWQTSQTFYEYITNVFNPWLIKNNVQFPVIVYLDGHSSHVNIPLVKFCREKKIEIIKLYPHSTHISQPLDTSFFAPFKAMWRRIVPKWKMENDITRLKKEHCPAVIKMTLEHMHNEKTIVVSGFKCCGLVPFNPDAIEYDVFNKKKKKKIALDASSIINNSNNESVSNTVCEDEKKFLETFEKNLSVALLEDFKKSESNGLWTGEENSRGLFEYWLKIKQIALQRLVKEKDSGNILIIKPTIINNEQLLDHKVIILKPIELKNISTECDIINTIEEIKEVEVPLPLPMNETKTELLLNIDEEILQKESVGDAIVIDNNLIMQSDDSVVNEKSLLLPMISAISVISEGNDASNSTCVTDFQSVSNELNVKPVDVNSSVQEKSENTSSVNDKINLTSEGNDILNSTCVTDSQSELMHSFNNELTQSFSYMLNGKPTNMNNIVEEKTDTHSSNEIEKSLQNDMESLHNTANEGDHQVLTQDPLSQKEIAIKIFNIKKEGICADTNKENKTDNNNVVPRKSFANAFKLPPKYLPKKNKNQKPGKPKLPSVGTSDEWWKAEKEKEEIQKQKEEQKRMKKMLMEEKRKLLEEKKKKAEEAKKAKKQLDEKLKDIQKRLKIESA